MLKIERTSERGNVFLAIFGAIALVGLLGASIMTFMKGPLSTSVRLTQRNTAENQMQIGSQVAVMATANQANNGDCDADSYVEPIAWRTPTASDPHPVNGGLIPLTLGISNRDPWGTEYGYCVWNHGATLSGNGCGANMLQGTASHLYPVVAIISAGPDKAFTTTCRNFAVADVNSNGVLTDPTDLPMVSKAAETDDDIITSYTYEEATGVSGGLWSIKSSDPAVAVINKSIETSGVANLKGGVLLPDKALLNCNDPTNAGVMAKSTTGIEICDGAGVWKAIGGGGNGTADAFSSTATCTSAADAGKVRYDPVSGKPEFCDGTAWTPFSISTPTGSLVVSPASNNAMNIRGPCSGGLCPNAYTTWKTFTVSNQGATATSVLSTPTITGTNASNYEIDTATSTCDDGIALAKLNAANSTCTVVLRAKASGNLTYTAQLNVTAGALTATVPLYGVATGFTCGSGTFGWGGIVVGTCAGAGGTVPGTNQMIIQRAGCGTATNEPTCTDNSANDPYLRATQNNVLPYAAQTLSGATNTATILAYGRTAPASTYCNDLVKDGYSDWFLPSMPEQQELNADPIIFATFSSYWYLTSTYRNYEPGDYDRWTIVQPSTPSPYDDFINLGSNDDYRVRCVRRHNAPTPTIIADSDPSYLISPMDYADNFKLGTYTPNLNTVVTSDPIGLASYNVPITVQVSGGGSPQIRVNGGAWGTSVVVNPATSNPSLEIRATSPASYGAQTSVSVRIGTDSGAWSLRTYDSTIVKNIFVTSTVYNGNMGGLTGANSLCQTRASAGSLPSPTTYLAFLATTSSSAMDNIGWNWGTLKTVGNNLTVAASPAAFVKGTLANTPNRTELGVARSANVWAGSGHNDPMPPDIVLKTGGVEHTCNNWTSSSSGGSGSYGTSGNAGSFFWINHNGTRTCNLTTSIYCVGPN